VIVNVCLSVCVVCRNLPALAKRLNMDETIMRKALSDSTQNLRVLDPAYKAYLPPVGGATVYFIGDIAKLNDPATEIAVRVHDGQNTALYCFSPTSPLLFFFIRTYFHAESESPLLICALHRI
jgi:hypothetical protein